ncbi:MAG: type II CAAX prenyl endopeptidase Rce1 family protein [Propioniciclava sp.]
MPTPEFPAVQPTQVDGRRVALFLAIALGGAVVMGGLLSVAARLIPATLTPVLTLSLAVLYMPLPMVAGFIVEQQAGRRPFLVVRAWRAVRAHPIQIAPILLLGAGSGLAVTVVTLLVALGLSGAGVPGAGTLVISTEELAVQLGRLAGVPLPADTAAALPPVGVLVVLVVFQGIVAGATVNAVFAFGEEYGWRGVLAEELAPLGSTRAHLIIGAIWGLWHVPLIVGLGYNFGQNWLAGIPLMVTFCIPVGFVMAWAAVRAGIFGASVSHGVLNGTAPVTVLVLSGTSTLIAPVGIAATLGATGVAAALWLAFPPATSSR